VNLIDNTLNAVNKITLRGSGVAPVKVSFTSPASSQIASGSAVSISVNVSATDATPRGNVRFTVDGKVAGQVTLSSGNASLTVASLTSGTHQVVAAYGGDPQHAPATASRTLTVQ